MPDASPAAQISEYLAASSYLWVAISAACVAQRADGVVSCKRHDSLRRP